MVVGSEIVGGARAMTLSLSLPGNRSCGALLDFEVLDSDGWRRAVPWSDLVLLENGPTSLKVSPASTVENPAKASQLIRVRVTTR